jgi:hypothetical protein
MMIASRRASATFALRMVERFAIPQAQVFSLSGFLLRVSITLAALVEQRPHPRRIWRCRLWRRLRPIGGDAVRGRDRRRCRETSWSARRQSGSEHHDKAADRVLQRDALTDQLVARTDEKPGWHE